MSADLVRAELQQIAVDGLITAQAVVEAARNEDSALHEHFTWDDTAAAEKCRLEEARRLIRVFVVHSDDKTVTPIRAFVSLSSDRKAGGGYRTLADVLSQEDLHEQMLQDALDELNRFKSKYARVAELKPIFKTVEKVEKRHRRRIAEAAQAAA